MRRQCNAGTTRARASTREPPTAHRVCSRSPLPSSTRAGLARISKEFREYESSERSAKAVASRSGRDGVSSLRTVLGSCHLKGIVVDHEGRPVGAAVVQVEDLISFQIRSFVTQEDGSYYFRDLTSNRDYTSRARYGRVWGSTRRLSAFDSRKEPTVNLRVDTRSDGSELRKRA